MRVCNRIPDDLNKTDGKNPKEQKEIKSKLNVLNYWETVSLRMLVNILWEITRMEMECILFKLV